MGEIKVTVQTEKRLAAISDLAIAIKHVAIALSAGTHVSITDNIFNDGAPSVAINTHESVTETKIEKL